MASRPESTIVRLSVGGVPFVSSRSTLTRYSDSFFAKLLDGALPTERDESGEFFIDRDGAHFRYILNFLRDGAVHLPPNDPQLRQELLREASFYQLSRLQQQLLEEEPAAPVPDNTRTEAATKVLHVLPSMGSVTNYALSWDANLKTIQQCQLEAQRDTDGMVEFVQLSNDCSLSFPLVDKGSSDKRVIRWFNTCLPLWRRVRQLETEGFGLHHIQSHAEGGIEYVVLCAGGASSRTRAAAAARRDDASGSREPSADYLRQAACDRAALLRLQEQLGVLRGDLASQEASRRELEEISRRKIDELTRRITEQ